MKELVVALMLWLSNVTPYPLPDSEPTIKFASSCDIQELYGMPECTEDGMRPVAMYLEGTIWLDDKWSPRSASDVSILVHELTHFMQDKAGVIENAKCIPEEVERPAYEAGFKWLEAQGIDHWAVGGIDPIVYTLVTTCPTSRVMSR